MSGKGKWEGQTWIEVVEDAGPLKNFGDGALMRGRKRESRRKMRV